MKRIFKSTVASLVLVLSLAIGARADEVDRYRESQLRSLHIPGASLAVVRRGKIVKSKGDGAANLQSNSAAAPPTV